jgi:DNA-binding PadR family transcriptional regulator
LKDVEEMSLHRVVLSTGTLYGALQRFLQDHWTERFEENRSSRGRHAYRLTREGRKKLRMEIARMKHLTQLAGLRVASKEA